MAEQQQNQEQVLLKTSFFGGFDKGEVLSYIDRLREPEPHDGGRA